MTIKLSTTLRHITTVPNSSNSKVISKFYHSLCEEPYSRRFRIVSGI